MARARGGGGHHHGAEGGKDAQDQPDVERGARTGQQEHRQRRRGKHRRPRTGAQHEPRRRCAEGHHDDGSGQLPASGCLVLKAGRREDSQGDGLQRQHRGGVGDHAVGSPAPDLGQQREGQLQSQHQDRQRSARELLAAKQQRTGFLPELLETGQDQDGAGPPGHPPVAPPLLQRAAAQRRCHEVQHRQGQADVAAPGARRR